LRADNPYRWREFAHLFGETFYAAVGALDPRSTDIAFRRAQGTDFWSWLATEPEERSIFDQAMEGGQAESADKLAALEWRDDEPAAAILRTIRSTAPDEARLLVLDSVVPPGNDPAGVKWLDLLMLVLQRGRERTGSDWRALLDSAGFRVDQIDDGLIQARCR